MCAVPNMAVFCSSLTSFFLDMVLTYFLNDFEIVPVVPIVTGINSVFTFHMRCIYIVRSLYFRIFSASFLITFLSPEIATSINKHVPLQLSRIIMSGLLLGIVLSVFNFLFHNVVIIIITILTFAQGIYTYIPETNFVPREYSVTTVLLLLFMVFISFVSVLNPLYFYISIFRSMCAVPNMAVFCSFMTSCFPGMLLTYFLKDFEIVPVAAIIIYFYCYNIVT